MTSRRSLLFLITPFLCWLAFGPAPAAATVAIHLDDHTHAQRSDLVVLATVRAQEVVRGEDGRAYTHTTLEVERSLKGGQAKGTKVTVRQMGGTLDGKTLTIPGDAHFEPGERVVAFLADREPETGVVFLTAMGQSKYAVVGTSAERDLILHRDLGGLLLLDAAHRSVHLNPITTLGAIETAITVMPPIEARP